MLELSYFLHWNSISIMYLQEKNGNFPLQYMHASPNRGNAELNLGFNYVITQLWIQTI